MCVKAIEDRTHHSLWYHTVDVFWFPIMGIALGAASGQVINHYHLKVPETVMMLLLGVGVGWLDKQTSYGPRAPAPPTGRRFAP